VNLQESGTVGSLAVALVALILTLFRGGQSRVREVDDLRGRVASLEGQFVEMKTSFSQIQKDVANLPVVSGKIDSLDRLFTYRMDELYDQLRVIARRADAPVTLPERSRGRGEDHDLEMRLSTRDSR
jgi:hypothetical protein